MVKDKNLQFRKTKPTILWDFDGTLAQGPGWSRTLLKVLDNTHPGHKITREQIRALLLEGFPWHSPGKSHPELSNSAAWWSQVKPILARAYQGVGYASNKSNQMAEQAHKLILDPGGYTLFEDTIVTLQRLSSKGWRHIILSNNFPELPSIIDTLPLKKFIYECFSSGITGYEKPHPKAFALALTCAGYPKQVWMVGDSLSADIAGAEAAGIPAILVHNSTGENTKYSASNLLEAAFIIENTS